MNTRARLILSLGILVAAAGTAHADFSVSGRLSREQVLAPGGFKQETVVVRNPGQTPVQVRAYQRDYLFYADGRNVFGEPGSVARSNSAWLTVTPHEVVIPPGQSSAFRVTLRVPTDEELSGTYWSVVMVEPVPDEHLRPPEPDPDKPQVRIIEIKRYAIQFVTHIGTSGRSEVHFAAPRIEAAGSSRTLQLDIENAGTRWVQPKVWAEIFDSNGVSRGRFPGGQKRIMPGCSARFSIDLSTLPAGHYQAVIVADGGSDDNVFGGRYQLDVKKPGDST